MDGESCIGTVVAVQRRPSVRWSRSVHRFAVAVVAAGSVAVACSPSATDVVSSSQGTPVVVSSSASPPESLDEASTAAPLCDAWTGYAATVAALAAVPDDRVALVEIVSAVFLDDAVAAIGDAWPTALVAERSAVLTDLVGPYSRRARKAVAALADSGASMADLAELRLVWREVVTDLASGGALPDRIAVPALLSDLVDAAVATFAAAVTPFSLDPTLGDRRRLLDPLRAPLTERYLERWCPGAVGLGTGVEF